MADGLAAGPSVFFITQKVNEAGQSLLPHKSKQSHVIRLELLATDPGAVFSN